MSDDAPHGKTHVIHASKGGGAMKWIAGAAAAAVIAGGGYYAYKNMSPSQQPTTDIAAYDDTTSSDQVHAGPLPGESTDTYAPDTTNDTTNSTAQQADSAQPTRVASNTTTRRRTTTSSTAAYVPEEVVGVTPVSVTTDSEEVVVTRARRPVWTRTPSARRLNALYPERALERGREGEASLHCTVLDTGRLDCVSVSEFPANAGFGNAALRVSRSFRHADQRADGTLAAGSPVNMRVMFRMADEDRRRG